MTETEFQIDRAEVAGRAITEELQKHYPKAIDIPHAVLCLLYTLDRLYSGIGEHFGEDLERRGRLIAAKQLVRFPAGVDYPNTPEGEVK